MRRHRIAAAVGILLVSQVLHLPAEGQVGGETRVRVLNNYFDAAQVQISAGESVTWAFETSGHSVDSNDGLFRFDAQGTVPSGQTREFVFPEQGVYAYHCRVHSPDGVNGMVGTVYVDVPIPTPQPTPEPTPPPQRFVPEEYPSISSAVIGAPADTVVNVSAQASGEPYPDGNIRLGVPGLVIRGAGSGEVTMNAAGRRTGFTVAAKGVRIEGLTVRNATEAGISVPGVTDFGISDVRLEDNRRFGLLVTESAGGEVRDVHASGAGEAGVSVRGCVDCDVRLDRITAEGNAYGYLAVNAGAVILTRSTFRDNATGIALATLAGDRDPPQRGHHVWGNTVEDNTRADAPRRGFTETLDAPPGVGIWVAGGWFDVIEANTITGHDRFGIVASWLTTPVVRARVSGNTLDNPEGTDLAWDGLGLDVCFADNRTPETGAAPSSAPPDVEGLYPCTAQATVGVPYPPVLAELAAGALHRAL